jgi:hypothetical protein
MYMLEQVDDWIYFEFQVSESEAGKFLMVEYEAATQPPAMLLASVNGRPTASFEKTSGALSIEADFMDSDGW